MSAGGNSFAPCDDHLGEHFLRELRTDLDELAARIAQLVRAPPEDLAQPMKASDCDKQPAPPMPEVSDKA